MGSPVRARLLISLEWVPIVLAASLMLALAGWLLFLDAGSRANRAFAAFLLFRAASMGLAAWRGASDDPARVELATRLLPYALLPLAPALLWFASVHPRPRWRLGRARWGGYAVAAFGAATVVAYALDHSLVWSYAPGATGAAYLAAGAGLVHTGFGPLVVLTSVPHLASAVLGLLFAADLARSHEGSRRFSALLLTAGFALNAVFDSVLQASATLRLVAGGESFPWAPWGWAAAVLPALTVVPTAALLVFLARLAGRAPDAGLRRGARRILVASALPLASGLLLVALGPDTALLSGPLAAALVGTWRLTLPLLATWALVRYQIFDADARVRGTIRAGTVVALFLVVSSTAAEVASNLIQARVGPWVGLGAAVALAFALRPIESAAAGFAKRLLPGARGVEELVDDERVAFYREQAALAWQDGDIREKERAMLDRLRARLGLSADAAARLEAEAARDAA